MKDDLAKGQALPQNAAVRPSPLRGEQGERITQSVSGSIVTTQLKPPRIILPTSRSQRPQVDAYVSYYHYTRMHSAIGHVTPGDKLNGLETQIYADRGRKLKQAGARRQSTRTAGKNVA